MESRPTLPAPTSASEPVASVAEDLPELYRVILDRVAQLERIGARAAAAEIRADATRVYSNAWDESARRVLASLIARADRAATAPSRSRSWSVRRLLVSTR
jgi:hypothetical protein